MMRILLIFFILLEILHAQIYNFRYYNTENGLFSTSITAISQDQKGYIWFGTTSGLFRYDGYSIENYRNRYNFFQNSITGFGRYDGNFWISTLNNGLFAINKNQVLNINKKNPYLSKKIKRLRESPSGLLIISQDNEFYHVKSDSEVTQILYDAILPETNFNDIIVINNGYAIASDEGLLIFQSGRVKYKFNQSSTEKNIQAQRVALDQNQNIVFLSKNGNVYRLDNFQLVEIYTESQKVYSNLSLLIDRNNSIWVGSDDVILRIDNKRKDFIGYENGLPHQVVTCLFEDREGNIWIGTINGAAKLNSIAVINYPSLFPKTTSSIQKIYNSGKEILVFSNDGISIFNSSSKTFRNVGYNFSSQNKVNDVMELSKDTRLLATDNGLLIFKKNRIINSPLNAQLRSKKVLSLAMGFDNKIYVGTDSGLFVFQSNTLIDYFSIDDILPGNEIRDLLITQQNEIYIGTDNGLVKLKGDSKLILRKSNGMSNNFVNSLSEDKSGRLWIGTKDGISSFKNGRFNNFVPKIGNSVVSEIVDVIPVSLEEIWAATHKGIFIIKDGINFSSFTARDGLISDFITDIEFDEQSGIIFIGTNSGLTLIEKKYLKENLQAYQIVFTGFSTNQKTYDLDKIVVPESESEIKVSVSTFSFFDENKIIYRYRLKNVEDNWNYLTQSNIIRYKNLSPGNYTLVIEASVDGVNWLKNSAELKFTVVSSFLKNFYFYAIILGGLFTIYFLVVMVKKSRKRMKQDKIIPAESIPAENMYESVEKIPEQNSEIEEIKKRFEEKLEAIKTLILEKDREIDLLKRENEELRNRIRELELQDLNRKDSLDDEEEFVEKSRIEIIVKNSKEAEEIKLYVEALEKTNWNIRAAAKLLNLPHSTFYYRLKKLNLLKNK